MRRYDRTHEKSNAEYIKPNHRVFFPRLGEKSTNGRKIIYLQTDASLDADIKRLATRFGTIDEQWLLQTAIHMLANIPLYEFNDVFESYVALCRRRNVEEKREKRKQSKPTSPTLKIMQAGGIDWLIWSRASGRTLSATAERIGVSPENIRHFLKSRYNTNWTKLGE